MPKITEATPDEGGDNDQNRMGTGFGDFMKKVWWQTQAITTGEDPDAYPVRLDLDAILTMAHPNPRPLIREMNHLNISIRHQSDNFIVFSREEGLPGYIYLRHRWRFFSTLEPHALAPTDQPIEKFSFPYEVVSGRMMITTTSGKMLLSPDGSIKKSS
jgi:hypothetical protein